MNQNTKTKAPNQRRKRKTSPTALLFFLLILTLGIAVTVCFVLTRGPNPPDETTDFSSGEQSQNNRENDNSITIFELSDSDISFAEISLPDPDEPQNPAVSDEISDVIPKQHYTVILDPGHGFYDQGCSSSLLGSTTEKELTLDFCVRIASVLEKKNIHAILTHNGVQFPSNESLVKMADLVSFSMEGYVKNLAYLYGIQEDGSTVSPDDVWYAYQSNLSEDGNGSRIYNVFERTYYANILAKDRKIDAFVSVHVNSVDTNNPAVDPNAHSGFTLYTCEANSYAGQSEALAQKIREELKNTFPEKKEKYRKDPWYDSYVVTKYTDMPSVLIETGYATNPTDASQLMNENFRQKMAQTIADGIVAYLQNYEQ